MGKADKCYIWAWCRVPGAGQVVPLQLYCTHTARKVIIGRENVDLNFTKIACHVPLKETVFSRETFKGPSPRPLK